jgi:hypothetical protein
VRSAQIAAKPLLTPSPYRESNRQSIATMMQCMPERLLCRNIKAKKDPRNESDGMVAGREQPCEEQG